MVDVTSFRSALWLLLGSMAALVLGSVLWLAGVTTPFAGALILCSAPVLLLSPLWTWALRRSLDPC